MTTCIYPLDIYSALKNPNISCAFCLYLQIQGKEGEFDDLTERAQVLLQNSTDSRLTGQLTQLTGRYTGLTANSKETLKVGYVCLLVANAIFDIF